MKKISVIIPCYNAGDYISQCLDSVIAQTIGIDEIEIIVIDDGSKDNSLSILESYERLFPNSLCVVALNGNYGQSSARNIGIEYASGEYLTFVDADDWIEPDMMQRLLWGMENFHPDYVVGKYYRDDGERSVYRHPENNKLFLFETDEQISDQLALKAVDLYMVVSLVRKSFVIDNKIYFPEGLKYEDNMWKRLLGLYVRSVYVLDEELYHYRVNHNSTVMAMDKEYHLDLLKVAETIWTIYEERGFIDKYSDALGFDFLSLYYLMGVKMLAYRFTIPPYEVYVEMCKKTNEYVPDWRNNKYVNGSLHPILYKLLDFSEKNISKENFNYLMQMIKDTSVL